MSETLPATLPTAVSPAQQQHIINIVRRASRTEILPRYRNLQKSDIATKSGPGDLVTIADQAAEAMLTRALRIAFPDALVVGEEAVAETPALLDEIADAPLAFIIDPVDGTWNFAHGLGVFGVILAVTQFGRPAFGLIYDPLADDWAMAGDETAAFFETAGGQSNSLKASAGKELQDLRGCIPLHQFAPDKQAELAATLPRFAGSTPLRCSAHEYRLLARGDVDFILTPALNPWDHAAGALICERAGAYVELLDGGPYTATRHDGHLLVAPDRITWNKLQKIFRFLIA